MQSKKQQLGRKAANLHALQKIGCRVPPFFTLSEQEVESEDIYNIVKKHSKRTFQEMPLLFAVRSSAVIEDTKDQSNAGLFHSELAVLPHDITPVAKRVAASLSQYGTAGSVIVQELIPSSVAGVLFTNAGDDTMILEANVGLCTTVVAGNICDRFVVDRGGAVLEKEIAEEKHGNFIEGKEIVKKSVGNQPVLSEEQIKTICARGQMIERAFGCPQDIEWCFLNDKLFILQTRPITRTLREEEIFYDSANIAESYAGVVLPLTFSFACEVYKYVYQDLLVASGVSQRLVERYASTFDNMISHFYGRMYYNMNNWYRMMAFLPGYDRNKNNLEHMVSSHVREDVALNIHPSLWLRIKYPFLVVWKTLFFKRIVKSFESDIKTLLMQTDSALNSNPSAEDCVMLYKKLHEVMLRRWYVTVENDFLVMTFFGALRKLIPNEKKLLPFLNFDNIGVQQVQMLSKLGNAIFAQKERKSLYEQDKLDELRSAIRADTQLSEALDEYLSTFGGRFANELKLESPDVSESMQMLFDLLHRYSQSSPTGERGFVQTEEVDLQGMKKRFFTFTLKRFRSYAKKREELRLLRSKAFSIVRRIFRTIGRNLKENGVLQETDDIFYLDIEEVISLVHGKVQPESMQKLIEQRKRDYKLYHEAEVRSHFSCHGSHPSRKDILLHVKKESKDRVLYGRGCTTGIVAGRVNILRDFRIPQDQHIEIIVARHTDPGWTPLIGLAKGMIIEEGGLLSHASIVSRELGIPTVIGVKGATQKLKDGQKVTLDGTEGTVTIHDADHQIHERAQTKGTVSTPRREALRQPIHV